MRYTGWLVLVGIFCLTVGSQGHKEKDVESIIKQKEGEELQGKASKIHRSPKFGK